MISKLKEVRYYIIDIILFSLLFILIGINAWVGIVAVVLYLIWIFIKYRFYSNTKDLAFIEHSNNVLKSGYRRRGKDLSTQASIIILFKRKYVKTLKKVINKMTLEDIKTLCNNMNYSFDKLKAYLVKNGINESKWVEYGYYYIFPNYLSNIDYGYGCRLVTLDEFRLYKDKECKRELTFNDFITDKFNIHSKKEPAFEGKNLYLSDGQIELPSSYHSLLTKYYPSFPIFMSLAGQLYHMNIINNSQVMSQLWDKLRNQQDIYITALDTYPRFKSLFSKIYKYIPVFRKYIFVKLRYYSSYESAERGILPFKSGLGIKDRAMIKQMQKQYESEHGKIYERIIMLKRSDIVYDTRFYHYLVFGYRSEEESR